MHLRLWSKSQVAVFAIVGVLTATLVPTGAVLLVYPKTFLRATIFKKLILPATGIDESIENVYKEHNEEIAKNIANFQKKHESRFVLTQEKSNGKRTLKILPQAGTEISKLIMRFPGQSGHYQNYFLNRLPDEGKALDTLLNIGIGAGNAIGFMAMNYRLKTDDLRTSIEDAKEFLKKGLAQVNGVHKKIVLWGFSMGGGVATQALSELVDQDPKWRKVKLINERSYSDLARTAAVLKGIPEPFARWLFRDDWQIDAEKALKTLDEKNVLTIEAAADAIIHARVRIGSQSKYGQNVLITDPMIGHKEGILGKKIPAHYLPDRASAVFAEGEPVEEVFKKFIYAEDKS